MFRRGRKKLEIDEQQATEFYRKLADYNAAVARLPPDWKDVAEGKAKLPASWDEARAQLGDAFAGVTAGTVQ